MSASEPHIPTPEEFAELPRPVRPQLTPLQILNLAQLWHEYPELALEMATDYGRQPLATPTKETEIVPQDH